MRYIKDYSRNEIIDCFNTGGVAIFPTETVYSLSCDAQDQDAVDRIYSIKRRPKNNPFAVLMLDLKMAMRYVQINDTAMNLIMQYSPGPVSYVLPLLGSNNIATNIVKGNTLAIRISNHKIVQEILSVYDKPLVGTSVNFSSQKSAGRWRDIPKEISDKVDISIVDDQMVSGVASTVIDLSGNNPKVLRQGELLIKDF